MLHLDRKLGQGVIIEVPGYKPITVSVSKIGRSRAKLSFDCDPPINIQREEIYWSQQDVEKQRK